MFIDTAKIVHVRFREKSGEIIERDISLDTPCDCPNGLRQLAKSQLLSEDAIGVIQIDTILLLRPEVPIEV